VTRFHSTDDKQESWVKSTRVIDRTFIILQKILSQRSIGIPTELPSIDELTLSEVDLEDMTTAERHNAKIHPTLLKIASLLSDSKSVPGETIDGLAGRLEAWLKSTLESVSESSNVLEDTTIALPGTNNVNKVSAVPSWQYLHNAFLLLDTLKAISLEIMICTSKNVPKTGSKLPKDVADTLKKLVHAIHEAIKSNTRALKSRITESGMLETLIDLILKGGESSKDDGSGGGSGSGDSELHGELQKTLEAGALEIFCGKLMESWEEGLGGIFQVSLQ
jgi:N-terminal acetyltransferase B complex non-catalytic subunit